MNCRFCGNRLTQEFIDLISAPPSNSFLTADQLNEPEIFYPLRLFVCEQCWLVQIDEYKKSTEIFSKDYAYFSSYSKSWLNHAKRYAEIIAHRLELTDQSKVVEIASNDGYLLQYFQKRGIPCLGIEPSANTARVARKKGIATIIEYFDASLARRLSSQGEGADLIIGNNVLAHVPDINDFVSGLKILLKQGGTITMEFPHLMRLVEGAQFDTIYHEHFSYFSLYTARRIFENGGLEIFDVEELPTHGGSLRIYAGHAGDVPEDHSANVEDLLKEEQSRGMFISGYYKNFQLQVDRVKNDFLSFLVEQQGKGKQVAAYGAAAKGNTLINYCGIRKDLIKFVVDASPHKQGRFLPGSHIPVVSEAEIRKAQPDYIVILPWNISDEIVRQLHYISEWGGKCVTAIPAVRIVS